MVVDYSDVRCADCRVETSDINEWYMVEDDVWKQARSPDFLCIGCLESRIGRKLISDDFKLVPLNFQTCRCRSERLIDRMGNFEAEKELRFLLNEGMRW